MKRLRPSVAVMGGALLLGAPCAAQVIPFQERTFNEQILRPVGQPVVPLFDGWFTDVSAEAGPFGSGWAYGGGFIDFDNDGWEDEFSVNGFVSGNSMNDT